MTEARSADIPFFNAGYALEAGWAPAAQAEGFAAVSDLAVGADGLVYMVATGPGQVLVFAPDGTFLCSFGQGILGEQPHGITVAGDRVWVTDQFEHALRCFTPTGELLMTLGNPGVPSDSGMDMSITETFVRTASIRRAAAPFHRPTNACVASNGEIYVADGYNNTCVHRFAADGSLMQSWGHPGPQPGQFWLVHHVSIDDQDRVLVCDRCNDRIQLFTRDGRFIEEWTGLQAPLATVPMPDGTVLVAELRYNPGEGSYSQGRIDDFRPGRISRLSATGVVLERSVPDRDGALTGTPFDFLGLHGFDVDAEGNILTADVAIRPGAGDGRPRVRKFRPR